MISAILAFFGFIHGSSVGWAVSPMMALSYVLVAILFYAFTTLDADPQESETSAAE